MSNESETVRTPWLQYLLQSAFAFVRENRPVLMTEKRRRYLEACERAFLIEFHRGR